MTSCFAVITIQSLLKSCTLNWKNERNGILLMLEAK